MEESKVMKGTSPETMLEAYNAAYWSCVPVLLMGAKPTPSTSKELMEKVDWTSLFNPNSKFYTAIRNALLPLNTEGRTLYLRTFIAHRLSNYSVFNKDDEKGNILCGFVLKAKNILDEQKNLSSVTDEERYIFRLYIHGRQIVENLGELASMCGVDWSAIAKEYGLVWAEEDTIDKHSANTHLKHKQEPRNRSIKDYINLESGSQEEFIEKLHNKIDGKHGREVIRNVIFPEIRNGNMRKPSHPVFDKEFENVIGESEYSRVFSEEKKTTHEKFK